MYLFLRKSPTKGGVESYSILDTCKNPLPTGPQESTLVSNMLSGDIFSSEVAISFIPEKPEIDVSTPSKVTVHDIEDSLESPSQGHEATIDPKIF